MTKRLRVSGLLAAVGALCLALVVLVLPGAQADPPMKMINPQSEILKPRALDIARDLETLDCEVKMRESDLSAALATSRELRSKIMKLDMIKDLVDQGVSTTYGDFLVDESLARAVKERILAAPGQTEKEKLANFASSKELRKLQDILIKTRGRSHVELAGLKDQIGDLRRKKIELERELKLLPFEAVSPAEAQAKE